MGRFGVSGMGRRGGQRGGASGWTEPGGAGGWSEGWWAELGGAGRGGAAQGGLGRGGAGRGSSGQATGRGESGVPNLTLLVASPGALALGRTLDSLPHMHELPQQFGRGSLEVAHLVTANPVKNAHAVVVADADSDLGNLGGGESAVATDSAASLTLTPRPCDVSSTSSRLKWTV